MLLKVKHSESNEWGFVETFKVYNYSGKGYIEAMFGITPKGKITKPYVFRGNEFIGADVISGEVGIDKYISAKKPFYSKLKDGFVVSVKSRVDFNERKFIPEKSTYSVYTINELLETGLDNTLSFKKILDVTDQVKTLMMSICEQVAIYSDFGDREKFILARLAEYNE